MKTIWVGLVGGALLLAGVVYFVGIAESEVANELAKTDIGVSSSLENTELPVSALEELTVIATSPNDRTAVIKQKNQDMAIVREGDFLFSGSMQVSKISAQAVMLRNLVGGDLTMVYLEGSQKRNFSLLSKGHVEEVQAYSSN